MKRLKIFSRYGLYALIALLFFTACVTIPRTYIVDVKKESKIGSKLGLDKSYIMIGAVIGDATAASDSVYIAQIASGMAQRLESNLGMESESIPVMMISRDVLDVNDLYSRLYLMESEQKNAFIILDSIEIDYVFHDENLYDGGSVIGDIGNFTMNVKLNMKIDVYNNSTDKPLYSDRDTMDFRVYIRAERLQGALNDTSYIARYILNNYCAYGANLAEELTFAWKTDERIIYLYDKKWANAFSYMVDFEFDKAIDIWLKYTSSSYNSKIKAAAAYNIAIACELSENYELALEWLDYSEKNYKIDVIDRVRKTIGERMER